MYLNNKNILITGGSGLIGSNILTKLLEHNPKSITATYYKKRKPRVVDDRIKYIQADLTDWPTCEDIVKNQDIVINCAAATFGAKYHQEHPLELVVPNIVMNTQLIDAAYKASVKKYIFLGSTTAYPDIQDRPVKEDELFDGNVFEKYYFCGWMKRYCEICCRIYGEKIKDPMTIIVLRSPNVVGDFDNFDPETSHVIQATVKKVVDRDNPIIVWGTGEDVRDTIHTDDLVNAIFTALDKIESYDTFNIGSGIGYSVNEILKLACELDGYENPIIIYDNNMPTMIPKRLLDVSKAKNLLDWEAKISIKEAVKRTIDCYRNTLS